MKLTEADPPPTDQSAQSGKDPFSPFCRFPLSFVHGCTMHGCTDEWRLPRGCGNFNQKIKGPQQRRHGCRKRALRRGSRGWVRRLISRGLRAARAGAVARKQLQWLIHPCGGLGREKSRFGGGPGLGWSGAPFGDVPSRHGTDPPEFRPQWAPSPPGVTSTPPACLVAYLIVWHACLVPMRDDWAEGHAGRRTGT